MIWIYTLFNNFDDISGSYFDYFSSANKYPVYAVQWHPEKNNFVWESKAHINHDANAVRVSQYFADFFVAQGILFCCTINAVKLEE